MKGELFFFFFKWELEYAVNQDRILGFFLCFHGIPKQDMAPQKISQSQSKYRADATNEPSSP